MVWGDPKAITREARRWLLALSLSYGDHHGRARIASDHRGGAREGGEPLLLWRSSGERTEALVAEDVWQVNICQSPSRNFALTQFSEVREVLCCGAYTLPSSKSTLRSLRG